MFQISLLQNVSLRLCIVTVIKTGIKFFKGNGNSGLTQRWIRGYILFPSRRLSNNNNNNIFYRSLDLTATTKATKAGQSGFVSLL